MISIPKGSKVNILLKNEQFVEVILLDVKLDHIIVDMDDHIFYIAISHIQTLSKNAKDTHITEKFVPYLDRKHLADLFDVLKYNWVTINGLGSKIFNGLLSNLSDDHILLINDTEILIIHKSFISNIYKGIYEPKEEHDDISSKEEVVLASPSFTDQKIKETEEPPLFSGEELQDSQHANQTLENQNPITNISESNTTTFIEKPKHEAKANHCILGHHFSNQKSESIEKNQCEGNEGDDGNCKEEVVLASPSFTDQKIKETEELPPLSREEIQDCQHDNQTIETITSINELKQTVCIENGDQEAVNHCIPHHQPASQENEREEYYYEFLEWHNGTMVKKKMFWSFH